MIYGANGYTGELAAREAVGRGLAPILAGRQTEAIEKLSRELDLSCRIFSLADPRALQTGLRGMKAVLHCAGPFVKTSRPMVEACLAEKAHYLDITGEIEVFEKLLASRRRDEAKQAGICLLPGVGFDVVPSDSLAARLKDALPDATELTLAFASDRGSWSRGTLKTMIESLPHSGAVRKDGKLIPVPVAFETREIEFGCGKRFAMTIPWGDVSTAFHTTGIPNIKVFCAVPRPMAERLRKYAWLLPLTGWKPVKRFLQSQVDRRVTGPDEKARREGRVYLWGEAKNAAGKTVTATLETPEAYAFTAVAAVAAVERVLAGKVAPGSWTPARAFGKDFVAGLTGVRIS